MGKKLTPKQKMFVKEYLVDLNATRAAIAAGYSKKTAKEIGYENLTKPYIAEAIQKELKERCENVGLSIEWVLEALKETNERCRTAVPVFSRGEGGLEQTGEWKFDSSGANRSAELIGKYFKMFTDKVEHSENRPFENMSDEELDNIIDGLEQEMNGEQ